MGLTWGCFILLTGVTITPFITGCGGPPCIVSSRAKIFAGWASAGDGSGMFFHKMPFSLYSLIMVNPVIRNLVLLIWRGEPLYSGSWFQTIFIFTPTWEDDPFDQYFSDGLVQPPTRFRFFFQFIDHFLRFCMASQEIFERSTKRIGKPEWCRTSIGTGAWDWKGFTIIRRDSHIVDGRNLAPPGMFKSW